MKMFITAVPLIMLVAPSLSQGSDEIGAVCNAALSQGLRDNYFLLTERQQFESYQNRLCDARYSSYDAFKSGATNLGLSVPVAEGLLGLSGSTESRSGQFSEKYSKYCSSTYFDKEYKERFSSYSNQVSDVLAQNWVRCHELHLDAWVKRFEYGVSIDVVPQDNFSDFTVNVENKKLDQQNIIISNISPNNGITCTRGGQQVNPGTTSIERNIFQLDCVKSPLRSVSFSLETNAGVSNVVNVPANNSKFLELDDRNRELQRQIGELRASLISVDAESKKNRYGIDHLQFKSNCTGNGGWGGSHNAQSAPACEAGWTDTGQLWNTDFPGGAHGQGKACRVCYRATYQ